jgi:hypothetical protein
MDCHKEPHTALTIAFNIDLYLAIIMDRYEGPTLSLL